MTVYSKQFHIAVIPGDGIGPEVISQGVRLLSLLNQEMDLQLDLVPMDFGAERYLKEGVGLPEGALEDLKTNYNAIYFGALGDPRIPDMAHGREILLGLRFGLDLYINLRPVKMYLPEISPLKNPSNIDFVVFRENTEDIYLSIGGTTRKNTKQEIAIDESIHTYAGVERIIQAAFLYAKNNNRSKVCLVDKSNAIPYSGALWQRVFKEVGQRYPTIQQEHLLVDNAAMQMVLQPSRLDVIVTSNLFGDILTDLGAGLMGGPGLAASANLHPGSIGLFEPIHGSAPDIAGQNKANPIAAFLSAAMMLEHLGLSKASQIIEMAVIKAIQKRQVTPDLGGVLSTSESGDVVCDLAKEILSSV